MRTLPGPIMLEILTGSVRWPFETGSGRACWPTRAEIPSTPRMQTCFLSALDLKLTTPPVARSNPQPEQAQALETKVTGGLLRLLRHLGILRVRLLPLALTGNQAQRLLLLALTGDRAQRLLLLALTGNQVQRLLPPGIHRPIGVQARQRSRFSHLGLAEHQAPHRPAQRLQIGPQAHLGPSIPCQKAPHPQARLRIGLRAHPGPTVLCRKAPRPVMPRRGLGKSRRAMLCPSFVCFVTSVPHCSNEKRTWALFDPRSANCSAGVDLSSPTVHSGGSSPRSLSLRRAGGCRRRSYSA